MTNLEELRARLRRNAKTDASTDEVLGDAFAAIDELEMLRDIIRRQKRGSEAEELRAGIEKVIQDTVVDHETPDSARDVRDDLRTLLDRVDARDSLAFLEQMDLLKKQIEDLKGTIGAREAELGFVHRELEESERSRVAGVVRSQEQGAELEQLRTRQDELLATIVKISQTTPFADEVTHALEQRGVLLAEIGTLRSRVADLEVQLSHAIERCPDCQEDWVSKADLKTKIEELETAAAHHDRMVTELDEKLGAAYRAAEDREARNLLAAQLDKISGGHSSSLVACARDMVEAYEQLERVRSEIQADAMRALDSYRMGLMNYGESFKQVLAGLLHEISPDAFEALHTHGYASAISVARSATRTMKEKLRASSADVSAAWETWFAGWCFAKGTTVHELGLGWTSLGGENQTKEAFRLWFEARRG